MKVFLTGATGFVGSHLLDRLLEAGEEVSTLVRKADAAERLHRVGSRYGWGILPTLALWARPQLA